MQKYITRQRKILIEYFTGHVDEIFSAEQLIAALKEQNISASAVYRNLSALEGDGKIHRVSSAKNGKIYYRYKGSDKCKDCLHLSCKQCGKTFHLNNTDTAAIMHTLSSAENFSLDKNDTILYGICNDCKG